MLFDGGTFDLILNVLGLPGHDLYLLLILFALILKLLELALYLCGHLRQLLSLLSGLLKTLLQLCKLLLIVFFLALEDEDCVILELLLRHLLETLDGLRDLIDVSHEGL